MKLIELHILQSFPVSCLNRDDVGAPKTATFGGDTRARISSQCLKRAIRLHAADLLPDLYAGRRSRLFVSEIITLLKETLPDEAEALAKCAADYLGTLDRNDGGQTKTLMFLSPGEYRRLAVLLAGLAPAERKKLCDAFRQMARQRSDQAGAEEKDVAEDESQEETASGTKSGKKQTGTNPRKIIAGVLKKLIENEFGKGKGLVKDAADIAIFGRMVANDDTLKVEGAGLFSHALSTHRAENDIDFFTAVDELQPDHCSGAGMMGTLEFTSAVYYRYAGLNLSMLEDADHLRSLPKEDRGRVVNAFLRATLLAVPSGRKNSMNAHTLPGYVLGLVKENGQPLQLVNAFEKPVPSRNGLMESSVAKLKQHHDELKRTWGIAPLLEAAIPEKTLDQFCSEIVSHV